MIVRLVRHTQFRPTTWRCRLCGIESTLKRDLCWAVEVRL